MTMKQLDKVFVAARTSGRTALMPYLMMGYPRPDLSLPLLRMLCEKGADIIEVGIPFSDPVADGPVIQAASQAALRYRIGVDKVLGDVATVTRLHPNKAIVLMTYYNVALRYGLERFVAACAASGVSGLIVPDLPLEECTPLKELLVGAGLHLVHMVSPNLSDKRVEMIARQASGFIYFVSTVGVTGVRAGVPDYLPDQVARIRRFCDVPVALGFGIGNAAQVAVAARTVDGVIIGSALIRTLGDPDTALANAASFMMEIVNYDCCDAN
jgi:tryptophan synthase alpha chain